jgi:predicted acyltransferase
MNTPSPVKIGTEPILSSPHRLGSLDAFRGLVIIIMFIVNVGGNDPALPGWFPHRGWNQGAMGNGLADLVFPAFLFIVGAAVPFSRSGGRGKGQTASRTIAGALWRGLKIYLLGTVIWCASIGYDKIIDAKVLLHWDILPLIGVAYALCVITSYLPVLVRVLLVAAFLIFKWAILTQLTLPGETGVLWTDKVSYQSYIRDQLGWWGVLITQGLAAWATAELGALAGGRILAARGDEAAGKKKTAVTLAGIGCITLLASYLWHKVGGLPYSKDFFTSSYILWAAGISGIVLGLFYYVADVRRFTSLGFLRVLGTNAIAVYFLAEFLWKTVLMKWRMVTPWGEPALMISSLKAWYTHLIGNPLIGTWAFIFTYVMFYWLVAFALYRKGWFVKV